MPLRKLRGVTVGWGIMRKISAIVLASALGLLGCNSAMDDKKPESPAPMRERVLYKDPEIQEYAKQVGAELGVLVVVPNAKDFANENEYRRTLSLLSANRNLLRSHTGKVDRIEITNETNLIENGGRYVVRISYLSSEKEMVQLLTRKLVDYDEAFASRRELSVITGIEVQDKIGFTREEIPALAVKLRTIAREVSFSQDPSFRVLTLANSYGVTPNGMSINITDGEGPIVSELKIGIDARLRWVEQLSPVLSSVRLNLSFQPGAFSGAELTEAIASAKKNAVLIKSLTRTYTNFVLGKRWDTDRATNTILIDFRASDKTITEKLQEIDPPVTDVDFSVAANTIQQVIEARGYHLDNVVINLPRSSESLDLVRQFTTYVAASIKAPLLQKLGVKTLHLLVAGEGTGYVPGTKILFVRLPSNAADIENVMNAWILGDEFDGLKYAIGRHAVGLGIEWNLALTPATMTNERLKAFHAWFTSTVNEKMKTDLRLRSVYVMMDNSTPTAISGGALAINLMNFAAEKMGDILFPPAPRPPVPPTPTPVPPRP